MGEMPVYYINLSARPDRKALIEEQLARLNLRGQRIEAKTPEDLSQSQIDLYCNPLRPFAMTPRQYACNLSHAAAWAAFLATRATKALFLEDDAVLSSSVPKFLSAVEDQQADIIRLETWPFHKALFDNSAELMPDELVLRNCLWRDAGAAAYILSRRAAKCLATSPDLHTTLVDGLIFNPLRTGRSLSIRYVDPGLCIQACHLTPEIEAAKSSIGGEGDHEFGLTRKRRSIGAKLHKQAAIWMTYDFHRLIAYLNRVVQKRETISRAIPYRP